MQESDSRASGAIAAAALAAAAAGNSSSSKVCNISTPEEAAATASRPLPLLSAPPPFCFVGCRWKIGEEENGVLLGDKSVITIIPHLKSRPHSAATNNTHNNRPLPPSTSVNMNFTSTTSLSSRCRLRPASGEVFYYPTRRKFSTILSAADHDDENQVPDQAGCDDDYDDDHDRSLRVKVCGEKASQRALRIILSKHNKLFLRRDFGPI